MKSLKAGKSLQVPRHLFNCYSRTALVPKGYIQAHFSKMELRFKHQMLILYPLTETLQTTVN